MSNRFLAAASDALPRADSPPPVGGSPPGRPALASRLAASASGSAAGGISALAARLASMTAPSPSGGATPVASVPSVATPRATVSSFSEPEIPAGGELHLVHLLLVVVCVEVPGGCRLSVCWLRLPSSLVPDGASWLVIIMTSSYGHWMTRFLQVVLASLSTIGPSVLHWGQRARRSFSSSPLQPHLVAWEEFSSEWPVVADPIFGFRCPSRVVNSVSRQEHMASSTWDQSSLTMGLSMSPAYLQAVLRQFGGSQLGSAVRRYHQLLRDDVAFEWARVRLERDPRRGGNLGAALSDRAWLAVEPGFDLNVGQIIPSRIVRRPLTMFTDSTPVRVHLSRIFATVPRGANDVFRMIYDGHPIPEERMRTLLPLYRPPPLIEEGPRRLPCYPKRCRAWMMLDLDLGESFLCHIIEN
mmetsp:Transcript_13376/g.19109  ORF Transcript_13376/g.19109 Transcript_13376/m.19109 type:complete len:413 (+) Transcript_13376:202-1440(+)